MRVTLAAPLTGRTAIGILAVCLDLAENGALDFVELAVRVRSEELLGASGGGEKGEAEKNRFVGSSRIEDTQLQ